MNLKFTNEEKAMAIVAVILAVGLLVLSYPYIKNSNEKNNYSVRIIGIGGECKECFDLALIEKSLPENTAVKSKEILAYNSEKGRELIKKYAIKSVPAMVVVSGDINKLGLDSGIFSVSKGYAVFDKPVPYVDLSSGEIMGLVELKEIRDGKCLDCSSLAGLKTQIEGLGIKIKDYRIIEESSEEGKNLIKENGLIFVPSLLASRELEKYWWIFDKIKSSFTSKANYYVFNNPIAPFKDIRTGKIKGKVNATYVTDNNCNDCYNVTSLKAIFQNIGVYINNERYVDVSSVEGKALLAKYNLTAIPTLILSKEISDYPIEELLKEVGTFENGEFVFRNLEQLNVKYKKL